MVMCPAAGQKIAKADHIHRFALTAVEGDGLALDQKPLAFEGSAKEGKSVSQGVVSASRIRLGPKERGEAVASVGPAADGEVDQQSQALAHRHLRGGVAQRA